MFHRRVVVVYIVLSLHMSVECCFPIFVCHRFMIIGGGISLFALFKFFLMTLTVRKLFYIGLLIPSSVYCTLFFLLFHVELLTFAVIKDIFMLLTQINISSFPTVGISIFGCITLAL